MMKHSVLLWCILCTGLSAAARPSLFLNASPTLADTPQLTISCLPLQSCDNSNNDPAFWNEAYWWDPVHKNQDLNEAAIDLQATASSLCNNAMLRIECILFLDLDQNGDWETVVSTAQPQLPNTVYFGNARLPNYQGGEPRAFDQRSVNDPARDYYRFALQTTSNGAQSSAALRFVNASRPDEYLLPILPHGTHKVRWIATDACNNQNICEQIFSIRDCQAPKITCRDQSVHLFFTQAVTLWIPDLLEQLSDNATPTEQLHVAMNPEIQTPVTLLLDPATGLPIVQYTYSCNDIGANTLYLVAWDAAGNISYCRVIINVDDPDNTCGPKAEVSTLVQTSRGYPIPNATVSSGPTIALGPNSGYYTTDNDGWATVDFNKSWPFPGMPAKICTDYDEAPTNGVDVKDLLCISKELQGNIKLSGLERYAADADRSAYISQHDVEELKKLILGTYDELPNHNAWTFFEQKSIPAPPFDPFVNPTTLRYCAIIPHFDSTFVDTIRFSGIKMGDIDGNARPNPPVESPKGALFIDVADRLVQAGEVFEVHFSTSEGISGQQFTLNYPKLQLLEIIPGTATTLSDFAAFDARKACTHVWISPLTKARPEFRLRFRAGSADLLSRHLSLTDSIAAAVACRSLSTESCAIERFVPVLRFMAVGSEEPEARGKGPVLYANQPNPFSESTQLNFELPNAGKITLRITDAAGRLCWQHVAEYAAGRHTLQLDGRQLPAAGVYYCTLQTGANTLRQSISKYK